MSREKSNNCVGVDFFYKYVILYFVQILCGYV